MCGRYSFAPKPKQLEDSLAGIELPPQLEISFNIAPTHLAYVVASDQPKKLQQMSWGLVPHWSADGKNSGKLINARAEGIAEKPSFRDAIQHKRCLVPADSFYEWRKEPGGQKTPFRIFSNNGALLMMAGIWDEWRKGETIKRTFSIITTTPNLEMEGLHDRMPVIFTDVENQQAWLSAAPLDKTLLLLHAPPDGSLNMYAVSEKLNKPGYNQADLQEPKVPPLRLF